LKRVLLKLSAVFPLLGMLIPMTYVILVPAFFAAEYPNGSGTTRSDGVSLIASALILIYMWLLMTRLDPAATRGLTQRLAVFPMFGWFSYASVKMLCHWTSPKTHNS
jgi:hypothetical protein